VLSTRPFLAASNIWKQLSDSSDNGDTYFTDPHSPGTAKRYPAPRPTDEQGYVIRRSVLEEGTRPEYIIPVGSVDGVWNMIKRVGRFRSEGWLALWKGVSQRSTGVKHVHDASCFQVCSLRPCSKCFQRLSSRL
jgi:hypothetical protein